ASWAGDIERARRVLVHPAVVAGRAPSGRAIAEFVIDRAEAPRLDRVFSASLATSTASWRTIAFARQAEVEIAVGGPGVPIAKLTQAVEAGLID
ncbi:hypothetical protein, partial [Glaesserella parasuis]|uniref:hypothetical protein n=1 Tax=Glaesserella parasuis TaxID=738 RepID=UPI003F348369